MAADQFTTSNAGTDDAPASPISRNPFLDYGSDGSLDVGESMDNIRAVFAFLQECGTRKRACEPTEEEEYGLWLINNGIRDGLDRIAESMPSPECAHSQRRKESHHG